MSIPLISVYSRLKLPEHQENTRQFIQDITGYNSSMFQECKLEELLDYEFVQGDQILIEYEQQQEQTDTLQDVIDQLKIIDYQAVASELNQKIISVTTRLQSMSSQIQQQLQNGNQWLQTLQKSLVQFTIQNNQPTNQQQVFLSRLMKNEVQYIKRKFRLRNEYIQQLITQNTDKQQNQQNEISLENNLETKDLT